MYTGERGGHRIMDSGQRTADNGQRTKKGAACFRSTVLCPLSVVLLLFLVPLGCTKTLSTSKPISLPAYKKTFAATPNQIYYALRWALKAYDYPIAEEDLQNGVVRSRTVPVKATSHYIEVFHRPDFGVSGAYHHLEVRLIPKNGQTEVQVASKVQGVVKNIKSTGQEEGLILTKVGDYLRSTGSTITNLGIQE